MSESKSRIKACSQPWTSAYRWSLEMGVRAGTLLCKQAIG